MAYMPQTIIGILIHPYVDSGLTLLFREVLLKANQLVGGEALQPKLITARKAKKFVLGDVTLSVLPSSTPIDMLFAPAMVGFDGHLFDWGPERDFVRASSVRMLSACLGSLLLADARILDGVEATTHWRWASFARNQFPEVCWRPENLLCVTPRVITAGGYLATVDLALHLVQETYSRQVAHRLGQMLLVDSSRQTQSLYASQLVHETEENSVVQELDRWVEAHIAQPLTVQDLARETGTSTRTLNRLVQRTHGVSPVRYLQLKRIEAAKVVLRDSSLSLDEVVDRVGVSDPNTFRELFRREIGLTPAEYRRRLAG